MRPAARRPRSGRLPLRVRRAPVPWERQAPTWRDAKPWLITEALKRARSRPSGNWYVIGASRALPPGKALGVTVGSTEVVAWRDGAGKLRTGPGACPHLGAPLRDSPVRCGTLVCHWHGLALDGRPFAGWEPYPAFDDGVLLWVRLDAMGASPLRNVRTYPAGRGRGTPWRRSTPAWGAASRKTSWANRLDPWHGAWFHPYSFVDLTVTGTPADSPADDDGFTVDVSFKVAGGLVVPRPGPVHGARGGTVVMHIVEGEGAGSVVETHATPLAPDERGKPRTAVTEALVAASDRRGFAVARAAAPLLRPLMRASAGRLWRDDLAYAERRWELRDSGTFPG
uniref:Methylesterase n=1 Tax=Streptomyces griseus TaxID=1911 RepID=P72448_STRGR|nr:methylesterase [Streptomyces griseus]